MWRAGAPDAMCVPLGEGLEPGVANGCTTLHETSTHIATSAHPIVPRRPFISSTRVRSAPRRLLVDLRDPRSATGRRAGRREAGPHQLVVEHARFARGSSRGSALISRLRTFLPGSRDYAGFARHWRHDVVAGITVGVVA